MKNTVVEKDSRSSGHAMLVRAVAGASALSILLTACGGGSENSVVSASGESVRAQAVTVNPSSWVSVSQPNDVLLQNLTIPADAPTRGMWSGVGAWPMVGLHQAILPDGKVLTWGTTPDGGAQNGRYFDVWDPNLGLSNPAAHNFTFDANRQDSFCAPAVYLGDGRLMITGGNGDVTSQVYTPSSNSYANGASVADSRWYATMVTLSDGRPMMLGGINPYTEGQWTNPDQSVAQGLSSMTPEVFENGAWRTLFGAQSRTAFGPDFLRASLPKVWLAPDGRVFGIGTDQMYYVDANGGGGNGAITIVGQYNPPPDAAANNDTAPNVGPTMSGVMYAPGLVMTAGGNSYQNGSGNFGSRKASSINLNGGGAVKTNLTPMNFPRNFANLIVLPDGKVLATGGETRAFNDPSTAVYAAEQWNPANNTWTTLSSAAVFRGYHSMTALLTNGTVLSTGGGNPGPVQLKGEVFYPPYLFRTVNGAAQLAPRPTMVGISGLSYANGATMQIDMASNAPITQLVMVGLSIGTHSFNAGQRRIPMTFSQEDIRLTATVPVNTLTPPGYYQVIAIDANGVPSRGTVVAVGQGVKTPAVQVTPYVPPTIGLVVNAPLIAAGGTASYAVVPSAGVTYSWSFGDGTAATPFNATPSITHVYANPGVYGVTLTALAANGAQSTKSFLQAVSTPATAGKPVASSATALETRASASARLWVANPDTDTVAVIDTANNTRTAELDVGNSPRSVAIAPDGRVWVTNKGSSTISIINPTSLAVTATVKLPRAAQPHGMVFAGGSAFVVLEATGQLLKLDPVSGATQATLAVGANPRHISASANGATVLVSRFITNPLPGESTAAVDSSSAGAEVLAVNASAMTLAKTIVLRHSDKVDNEVQGSGIPNYLAAAVVSPDGKSAWVPSKQDNIKRGTLRNGQPLDFQNSVRAISSRIDVATLAEDYARRIDHDNSSLGSAAAFHPSGAYLFVVLETSRQVAVVDAEGGRELAKFDVGRAPQAVSVSADGTKLYVQNFMDRTVSVLDLGPLVTQGLLQLPVLATVSTVGAEKLTAQVLQGKQLFYDARDPRLARDSYMSCASCHSDAGHDGRTWDFTGFGEGLRNTPALKGRGGMAHGIVHWSGNFDEIQDFEGQIRNFAGGTGLMNDAQFNTGTRNTPLGDRKAGVSADLDALAAYLGSLTSFENSPNRNADGTLTVAALAGKAVFTSANCASCHGGPGFTFSSEAASLKNIGTIKATSGKRLGAALTGLDVPTLRDAWKTGPYLHDGSAPTLAAAVQAHAGNTVSAADLTNLVSYLQQIGGQDATAPGSTDPSSSATPPSNSLLCATEGQTCSLPVGTTATVWYGANGSWVKTVGVTGSFACTNATFGDPIIGTVKSCRYAATAVATSNAAPSVSLTAPLANATFLPGAAITLTANAADSDGAVAKVEFFDGSTLIGTASAAPWSVNWTNAGTGTRTLTARATDNDGKTTNSAAVTITVTTTPPGNAVVCANEWGTCTLPTSAIATVWFGANASWSVKTGITGSIGCNNGVFPDPLVGAAKACRYLVTGSTGSTPPNVAPTVSFAAPAANASFAQGAAITLTANVADSDGTVAKVEFFDGSTLIGTASAATWSLNWTNAAAGTHTLTARATDNSGAATTSAAITVNVSSPVNVPPANAVVCAAEGATCTLPGGASATVWYGANASWATRTGVVGTFNCTNATFGDPLVGTVKQCRYVVTGNAPGSNGAATLIPLSNPGFEAQVLADGVIVGGVSGWTGGTGTYNPSGFWYAGLASTPAIGTMSGPNVGYLWAAGAPALQQLTTAKAVAGTTYRLTVAVGGRTNNNVFAGVAIEILAGGVVVASQSVTAIPVPGSFADVSVSWTAPAASAGAALGVRIRALNPVDGSYVDVDNVRLTY